MAATPFVILVKTLYTRQRSAVQVGGHSIIIGDFRVAIGLFYNPEMAYFGATSEKARLPIAMRTYVFFQER